MPKAKAALGGALEALALLASTLLVLRMGGDWIAQMLAGLGLMVAGPVVALLGAWFGLRASRGGDPWRFGGGRQVLASALLIPALLTLEAGLWSTGVLQPLRRATDPFEGASNEAVRRALTDQEATQRLLAAHELVTRGDPQASRALLPLLSDPAPEVRASVAGLIGRLRGAGAFDALRPLLGDPDLGARLAAVRALGGCGDPRAVDALAGVLGDALLGGTAADALADTGDPRAVLPLIASLESTSARGSQAEAQRVVAALQRLTSQHIGMDPRAWRAWQETRGVSQPASVP